MTGTPTQGPTATPHMPGVESTIKTIYIVPMSHLDIGFTAPPDAVADQYKGNGDLAMKYLRAFPGMLWNFETTWVLDQWLQRTQDADSLGQAEKWLREGRLGLGAGYANMHSALMNAAELFHFLYQAQDYRQRFNLELPAVIQNDVPGFTWAYPQVFARSGVRFFISGPNTSAGGGGAQIPLADNPFWWEAPDGSRVLTWISPGNYTEGPFIFKLNQNFNEVELRMALQPYIDAGYPYDAILVQHAFDNWDADQLNTVHLAQQVEQWNRTRKNLKFVLATPEDFFEHMLEKYGDEFKVYRGDWSGLWEQVKILSPAGVTLARGAKNDILAAESMASLNTLLGGALFPAETVDDLYRQLLDFDEHSLGSIIPWPGLMTADQANHDNALRYDQAMDLSGGSAAFLKEQQTKLANRMGVETPAVVVINTLAWDRSEPAVVSLPPGVSCPCSLVDELSGKTIPSELKEDGQLLFVAGQVPAFGYRRYLLVTSGSETPKFRSTDTAVLRTWEYGMENEYFRIEVDPLTGAITRLEDVRLQRSLLDAQAGLGFNALLTSTHKQTYSSGEFKVVEPGATIITQEQGELSSTLTIQHDGSPFASTRITLVAGQPWIEWENVLDRGKIRWVPANDHSDHYFFAFPLALEDSRLNLYLETASGFLNPAEDLLPGANGRGFSVQHVTALEGGDSYTALLVNVESFLSFAENITRSGVFAPLQQPLLLSEAMAVANEGPSTDQGTFPLKDGEPAAPPLHTFTYRLAVQPRGFDPAGAARLGWETHQPLAAVYLPAGGSLDGNALIPAGSFFRLDSRDVAIVEVKGATFGDPDDIILRLQALGEQPVDVRLESAFPIRQAWIASGTEQIIEPIDPLAPLRLEGNAIITLRLQVGTMNQVLGVEE